MMSVLRPWTNCLRLSWSPCLSYYERRLEILRSLEDAGDLHAFRIDEDEIGARLGAAHHELRVSSDGLLAALFGPEERDESVVTTAVTEALELLQPSRLRNFSVFLQHLVPLEERSYDEMRKMAAGLALGEAAQPLGAVDCAVLFDGVSPLGPYQAEFGVVREEEIEARLLRSIGRANPLRATPTRPLPSRLPSVALYVESDWTLDRFSREDGIASRWVLDGWEALERYAAAAITQLRDLLVDTTTRRRGTG